MIEKSICPECKKEILTESGYFVWCQTCNWNLKFEDKVKTKTKLEEFYKKISSKHSKFLFNKIKNTELDTLNKTTPLRIIAYIISIIIITINLSFLFTGLYLILRWEDNLKILVGVILLAIFWFSKPRIYKLPKDKFVSREKFPELYNLVNLICKDLKTSEVEGVILTEEFNAAITEFGLSKKKVLWIGLPLWTVLNNQEKLALLGHEISHCINKDPIRSTIIIKGVNILIDTGWVIYPQTLVPDMFSAGTGMSVLVFELSKYIAVPFNIIIRGISHILWYLAEMLSHLLWMDSQRSEYLADLSGSSISGKENFISLMNKLSFFDIFQAELQKIAIKPRKEIENTNFFEILKNKINSLPDHEIERLKRIQDFEEHYLDSSHPPTKFRKEILQEKGGIKVQDYSSLVDFDKIEKELLEVKVKIQEKLIDLYKNYINRVRYIKFD